MLRTIDKGTESNVDDAKTVVVRDAAAWKKLWQGHAPDRALPAVDFSREMVVAVFMGSRPTSGLRRRDPGNARRGRRAGGRVSGNRAGARRDDGASDHLAVSHGGRPARGRMAVSRRSSEITGRRSRAGVCGDRGGRGPGPAPSTAQGAPQQPTFKVQVDYVEVDAIATDRAGGIVSDLKKEDFKVIEDGQPQTITAFTFVHIPVEQLQRPLGAAAPIEPDVKDNERPFDGRLYVMIIDDQHTAFARTQPVKRAAKEFIDKHLGSNDLMAVVHTAGGPKTGQELTSNKRLLIAAVDQSPWAPGEARPPSRRRAAWVAPRLTPGACTLAVSTLDTIRDVADVVRRHPRPAEDDSLRERGNRRPTRWTCVAERRHARRDRERRRAPTSASTASIRAG